MRATVTVTGDDLDTLGAALDIASGGIVQGFTEGEGWEFGGPFTYTIALEGEADDLDAHPHDCAACAAGEPSVHAYEPPTVPTPEEVAARTLADHAIKPHWVRNGVQVAALIAEAVAADRASR